MRDATSKTQPHRPRAQTATLREGFSLIELMIVVAIIGILAAIAIPNYARFQLRSKTAEAKVNLGAIRTAEVSYRAEFGFFIGAPPSPAAHAGSQDQAFVDTGPTGGNFSTVGWRPEGNVFFHYAVQAVPDGFTADAAGDLDANGTDQVWGYVQPDSQGISLPGALGCAGIWDANAGALGATQIVGPCGPTFGQGEF